MIKLFCTKKLADLLPEKLAKAQETFSPLDCWYANVLTVQRRKVVAAICADNRFGFVLWGVKKAQMKDFPAMVLRGIRKTLEHYSVKPDIIAQYVPSDAPLELYAASDRKGIAAMNKTIELIGQIRFYQAPTELIPFPVVHVMNQNPYHLTSSGAIYPNERMMESLRERYGQTPVSQRVFVLEASMDLERYVARRTLLVPCSYSFLELHRILQIAFGWENGHLHEFILPNGSRRLFILCTEEDADMLDEPYLMEEDALLSEQLRVGGEFTYLYDFGDSWEVNVRVASVLEDYDQSGPSCTDCEGAAPPEDVGGVYGFLEFLDAMADPEHPDHEDMAEWIGHSWKPEPNLGLINMRLRY